MDLSLNIRAMVSQRLIPREGTKDECGDGPC
jgi:Tfp pilus assembly ATPase PilU